VDIAILSFAVKYTVGSTVAKDVEGKVRVNFFAKRFCLLVSLVGHRYT
jgi:hypothetical protein